MPLSNIKAAAYIRVDILLKSITKRKNLSHNQFPEQQDIDNFEEEEEIRKVRKFLLEDY